MKDILAGLAVLILLVLLIWALAANQLGMQKVFAPRFEDVRRETFEHSRAFRQGGVSELQNMQFEYLKATPESQKALRPIILRRASEIEDLPPDLEEFINSIRKEYN